VNRPAWRILSLYRGGAYINQLGLMIMTALSPTITILLISLSQRPSRS
jgi:hypothetical protein